MWRYTAITWRWKWIVLPLVILPVVAAAALSAKQQKQYTATAQVLIEDSSLANALADLPASSGDQNNQIRALETQATVARSMRVAEAVARDAGDRTASDVLASSTVKPDRNANILSFGYTDADPQMAVRLVNAYATAFTNYRRDTQAEAIRSAAREVDRRLRQLADQGSENAQLRSTLQDKRDQLETLSVLQTSNAEVVNPALGATKTAPKLKRNVMLGLLAGIALAWMAATLLELRRMRDPAALVAEAAVERPRELV